MATVMISIDGKTLRFACDEGDEARLLNLARKFDSYISRLKAAHGNIGEYRLSVMAGIMALDEMSELTRRAAEAEAQAQKLLTALEAERQKSADKENILAEKVDGIAQRIIIAAGKIALKPEH